MTSTLDSEKSRISKGKYITGTLMWYYKICPREVWLMSREINPFQDFEPLDYGRFIHEKYYKDETKEVALEGIKIDLIKENTIYEVKTSDRYLEASLLQLKYYLYRLYKRGIRVKGELHIPEKKKIIKVELDENAIKEVEEAIESIKQIIEKDRPPPPKKTRYCARCAYREFCWA